MSRLRRIRSRSVRNPAASATVACSASPVAITASVMACSIT